MKFNSWILAIKAKNYLKLEYSSVDAVNILFPPCFIEFKIEDKKHGFLGRINKIEIVDG